jgi:formate/nitrite transporter FocA (FNT family)
MVTGEVFAHREAFTIELALKKTSYSFYATMVKGIMCNWLVCMAVWQGNAAQDVTGKLLGIWFPISAFVTSGCVRVRERCRDRVCLRVSAMVAA